MKMKFTLTLLHLLFLTFFCSYVAFAQTVNVTAHGATVNNSSNDDTAGIRAAIDACRGLSNPVLRFPTGAYHLDSEAGNGNYFFINGIDNLTIDGAGSTIIITGGAHRGGNARNTFVFWNCKNLKIKDLNTDFENPPFSQGRIIAQSNSSMDVQILDGFSMEQDNGTAKRIKNIAEYNPVLGQQVSDANHTWPPDPTWTWINESQNRIRVNDNRLGLTVGKYILLRHSQYDGYTFTFERGCEDVVLDNVNVYKASGYPFYASEGAKNLSFLNTGIRRSSPEFWATSTADGAHLLDARGEIIFDNCHFEGMCDDGINLHSFFTTIPRQINNRSFSLRSLRGYHSLVGWAVGDTIEFFSRSTKQSMGTRVVSNIIDIRGREIDLQFTENVPSFPGGISSVYASNISCVGNLTVRNSTFKGNRARGILVSTDNVLIENCTFERNLLSGILMEVSEGWDESNPSRNLVIRNNVFNDVLYGSNNGGVIYFHAQNQISDGVCDVFKNAIITGNTFINSSSPAIRAEHVSGLTITNNSIENPRNSGSTIRYEICKNITIGINPKSIIDNRGGNCLNDVVVSVSGITVTPQTATLALTQTMQLTANVLPFNATNKSVTWSSSNPSVVSVNPNTGLVTAVSIGAPVTITAKTSEGGYTDTSVITVDANATPEGIISVEGPVEVLRGQVITVTVAYNSYEERDVVVLLQEHGVDLNGDNNRYSIIAETRVRVSAGQNTITEQLTVNTSAPFSNTYRYSTYLTTVGGGYNQRIDTEKTQESITVTENLSTSSVSKQNYSVYPNPVEDYIQVAIPNTNLSSVHFKLYDMIGKLVLEKNIDSKTGKWQIDVSSLAQGIHILEIKTNNQVMYHKVVKK